MRVADVLSVLRPAHTVTFAFHQLDEMSLVDRVLHRVFNGDTHLHLPAFAFHGGVVFGLTHLLDALVLRLLLADAVAELQTHLVVLFHQRLELGLVQMVLFTVLKAD